MKRRVYFAEIEVTSDRELSPEELTECLTFEGLTALVLSMGASVAAKVIDIEELANK